MEIVQVFKVLSDETRFKLINLLLTHDLCVGALAHHLGISEAAVSQHLKQLREVGLVKGEKRGYWTHYMVERNKDIGLIAPYVLVPHAFNFADVPAPIRSCTFSVASFRLRRDVLSCLHGIL